MSLVKFDEVKHRLSLPRGERHHRARLTEQQVREIRRLHSKGVCCGCIVKVLDLTVSQSTVWECANYQTWVHVR